MRGCWDIGSVLNNLSRISIESIFSLNSSKELDVFLLLPSGPSQPCENPTGWNKPFSLVV